MRIVYFFVFCVGFMVSVDTLYARDWISFAVALTLVVGSGVLLARNLRDPAVTRANGLAGQMTFVAGHGDGFPPSGTAARLTAHQGKWNVVLDRPAQLGDMDLYDTPHSAWIWLGEDGLPEKAKLKQGSVRNTWPVLSAVHVTNGS